MSNASQLLAIAAQLTILAGSVGAGLLWFKRWVRKQVAEPVTETTRQLETSNGHTIGQIIESTQAQVTELTTFGKENRSLIQHLSDRLDAHLKGHG